MIIQMADAGPTHTQSGTGLFSIAIDLRMEIYEKVLVCTDPDPQYNRTRIWTFKSGNSESRDIDSVDSNHINLERGIKFCTLSVWRQNGGRSPPRNSSLL
jgi:hypothetical protein